MRDFFAIIAIILAVIGLGVFRVPDENALVAAGIKVAAEGAVYQEKHPIRIEVKGREITAFGRVESKEEARQIEARLAALEGVQKVVGDWTILPNAAPFTLRMSKDEGGISANGYVPNDAIKQAIAQILDIEDTGLTVAAGVPDGQWGEVALQLAREMAVMRSGQFDLVDRTVQLNGEIDFPVEKQAFDARLTDLPEGYIAKSSIAVLDDGTPYRLLVTKDDAMGLRYQGKVGPDFEQPDFDQAGRYGRGELVRAKVAHDAPDFDQAVGIGLELLGALPKGSAAISIGSIAVTGGPISSDQAKKLGDAAQQKMPAGYALSFEWTPEEDETPLVLQADWDGQEIQLTGHVPSSFLEIAPGQMPEDAPAEFLRRAGFGMSVQLAITRAQFPDLDGWDGPFWQALGGLQHLETGRLVLDRDGVQITGTARDPQARRAAFQGAGDAAALDLMLVDDGAPPKFLLSFDVGSGASVEGKLPAGLTLDLLAQGLGIAQVRGQPPVSPEGSSDKILTTLAALRPWLTALDGFTLSYDAGDVALNVQASPGQSAQELADLMPNSLPVVQIRSVAGQKPLEGTRRTHMIMDQAQIFSDGYWLPSVTFEATLENCQKQTLDVEQIPFDQGRFPPAFAAHWPLAHLAAVAKRCSRFGQLNAEISAEVGSSEIPELNSQLARRRAEAIRLALVARGVSEDHLRTVPSAPTEGPDQVVITWR